MAAVSYTDDEIAAAARLALIQTVGVSPTITAGDVLAALGVARSSRLWESRNKIVSGKRVAMVLKRSGFIQVNTKPARFTWGCSHGC